MARRAAKSFRGLVIGAVLWMFAALFGLGVAAAPIQNEAERHFPQHRNISLELDSQLDLGERILAYLAKQYGQDAASRFVNAVRADHGQGSQPSAAGEAAVGEGSQPSAPKLALPYGFWQAFIPDCLHLRFSKSLSNRLLKALKVYVINSQGAMTRAGMRSGRRGKSKRKRGGEENASKDCGIGHELLQWFVDELQNLKCRQASIMFLGKAREMRDVLLETGEYTEDELPKLTGSVGRMWMLRWRKRMASRSDPTG